MVAPYPSVSAAVRMNLLRRVQHMLEMILIPETVTDVNRNVVIPPRTDDGIDTIAAANFAKMPMMIRKKQAANPALRLAHLVKLMTPLFCANTDIGVIVHRPAMQPESPSARIPPWMRESNKSPSTSNRETSQVAVMSPIRFVSYGPLIRGYRTTYQSLRTPE